MKRYDFLKAKKFIETNRDAIQEAYLGMDEDWGWTAELVFSNGEFLCDLSKSGLRLTGIDGSSWATPVLEVNFKDGTTHTYNCYAGESDGVPGMVPFFLGVSTWEISEARATIIKEEM